MKRAGWFQLFLALILFLVFEIQSMAQSTWSFELSAGTAHSFSSNLTIEQRGFPDLRFDANYDTNPLEDAPYYAWRISRWKANQGWELELIHHKVYLTNNPPEVQQFEVTHGYSLLTVNSGWNFHDILLHLGGGVVIAYPEAEIREMVTTTGYDLAGVSFQIAAGKRFYLGNKLFLLLEGKFTAAYASIPIQEGTAKVPNFAMHGLLGLGYSF